MKKFILLSFILFLFVCYSGTIHAQFNEVGQTQVTLEAIPETPGPNELVQAKIDSYGTNLDVAMVSWYVNGKKITFGKGIKTFSFSTGLSNTTTSLEVVIVTSNGEVITKSYKIKPSTVDIIWQNEAYVPPFYKGKALYSYQNKITFIAIPHILSSGGVEINPSNLIYKWTKNGTVLGDFSGYGKSTYTMISSIISRPLNMEVEVTSPNSDDIAYSSIYVAPIDPMIIMYEKNPLYGMMYEKALVGNISYNNLKELEIVAVPFFFGTTYAKNYNLPYKWSLNYSTIDNDFSQTSRVFRPKEGASGTSNVSVSIENQDKVLQSARGSLNIQFNNTTDTASNPTF